MIAIGIGCRKGCAPGEIESLAREALGRVTDRLTLLPSFSRRRETTHPSALAEGWVPAFAGMTSIYECVKIFTIADKRHEPGLAEAAHRLGLDLAFVPREALREQAAKIRTASPKAEALFGVPSVAEAAALAGAGPGSSLIVPRIANAVATCAIAASHE